MCMKHVEIKCILSKDVYEIKINTKKNIKVYTVFVLRRRKRDQEFALRRTRKGPPTLSLQPASCG